MRVQIFKNFGRAMRDQDLGRKTKIFAQKSRDAASFAIFAREDFRVKNFRVAKLAVSLNCLRARHANFFRDFARPASAKSQSHRKFYAENLFSKNFRKFRK